MNPFVNKELVACALKTKHWSNALNYKTRLIKELSQINLIDPRKPDSCKFNTEMMDFEPLILIVPLIKRNLDYTALRYFYLF